MNHILSADERAAFLNDMIREDMRRHSEKAKEWLVSELITWRFYHRENCGHDSNDKVHRYMDQKKVPRSIPLDLWQKYKESDNG